MSKVSDTKKKNDWLELDDNENDEKSTGLFSKDVENKFHKNIYDSKKGKILLDLQKTFKGDDRFHLNKSFKNDVEFDKLPNNIKLANRELEFDLNETEKSEKKKKKKEEINLEDEKNSQMNILKSLFPREKINNDKKKTHVKTFDELIVPRFDPTKAQCKNLIIDEKKKPKKKKEGNKLKIESGIDRKKKNLLKAQAILKEKLGDNDKTVQPARKKIKKIDYQAWKNLMQESKSETNQPVTLFSK